MKKTKVVKKEVSKTETVSIRCDSCGTYSLWGNSWDDSPAHKCKTKIKMVDRTDYGQDDSGKVISYDLCPKCFKEKLMPFMESIGAKPNIETYGY